VGNLHRLVAFICHKQDAGKNRQDNAILMMTPNNLRNIAMIFIFTFIPFYNLILILRPDSLTQDPVITISSRYIRSKATFKQITLTSSMIEAIALNWLTPSWLNRKERTGLLAEFIFGMLGSLSVRLFIIGNTLVFLCQVNTRVFSKIRRICP